MLFFFLRQFLRLLLPFWFTQYIYFYLQDVESTPRLLSCSGWVERSKFSSWLVKKTKTRIIWTKKPTDVPKQYILAVHPHGVWSIGHLIVSTGCLGSDKIYPPWDRRGLTAKIMFKIPILRELCLHTNLVNASRESAERCLKAGLSLSVVPGGEREQLLSEPGKEVLILKKRKGFIRLALKYKIPVIPVYCFGENDLTENPKILFGLRSWIQRKFGIALAIPFTWWWGGLIPVPITLYPTPPLTIAYGEPVYYDKIPQSPRSPSTVSSTGAAASASNAAASAFNAAAPPTSDDAVDAFHTAYIQALKKLFDEVKESAGFKDRELCIF